MQRRIIDVREKEFLSRILDPFVQEIENRLRHYPSYWIANKFKIPDWDCSYTAAYFSKQDEIFISFSENLDFFLETSRYKEMQKESSRISNQADQILNLIEKSPNHRIGIALKEITKNFRKAANDLKPILREARFRESDALFRRELIDKQIKMVSCSLKVDDLSRKIQELINEAIKVSPFTS